MEKIKRKLLELRLKIDGLVYPYIEPLLLIAYSKLR